MAFKAIAYLVKRPNYYTQAIGTINARAVLRGLCLCVYGYLVVPSGYKRDPRFSFLS